MSLSALAPRLPPTTSSRSGPLRPAKRVGRIGLRRKAVRSGLPTHCAFFSTSGKAREHAVGHAGQHLVGQPGDRVLLVQHQRLAQQHAHHAARKADVAAQAEHHVGPHAAHRADALPECAQQLAAAAAAIVSGPLPRTPPKSIGLEGEAARRHQLALPCCRARPASARASRASRRASATARPGKIWPPVPPAMTSGAALRVDARRGLRA